MHGICRSVPVQKNPYNILTGFYGEAEGGAYKQMWLA